MSHLCSRTPSAASIDSRHPAKRVTSDIITSRRLIGRIVGPTGRVSKHANERGRHVLLYRGREREDPRLRVGSRIVKRYD
jgi:hypothetical protein